MIALSAKRFTAPDETRSFLAHGHMDLLRFGDRAIGRGVFEPGWRWSDDIGPLVGTKSCQGSHQLYVVSGSMRVTSDTGESIDIGAGDVAVVLPGHDAVVTSDEPCVLLDFGNVAEYARPIGPQAEAVAAPRPQPRH